MARGARCDLSRQAIPAVLRRLLRGRCGRSLPEKANLVSGLPAARARSASGDLHGLVLEAAGGFVELEGLTHGGNIVDP